MLELIHPDDARLATEAWNEVADGTNLDAVTVRLRRESGSYAWFEVNGTAVREEDGELRFMLGTARDVSEREELRSRLRDLDAVYRFADAVAGAPALDEVLEAALDALLEATGADRASVLLADEEGVLRFRAWRGLSDRYRAYTEGRSPWPADVSDPQPVLVEDVAGAGYEPALERVMRKEGIAALALVPLVRGGLQLGRFVLYRDAPHDWSDREVLLSRTIANHLASVIERTQAQHEAEGSRARLALLLEATEQLTQTLDYEELLRRVPQLVVPRIADGCHVYLARNEEAELVRVAHAHVEPRISALLDKIDPVYDIGAHPRIPVVQVFRTGKPIHRPALKRPLKKVARPGEEELVRMESRSLIVVPLEAGGKRLGVLAVTSAEPGRHGDEDFELVSELARRVSLALDLVGLHRRAQDSLAQLQAVIAQLPLGVAITDADHRIILLNDEVERVWGEPVALGSDHRGPGTEGWPLERALETGEVTIGERREVERDDGTRTLEISAAPVRDADGAIVSAVAILADVTRRSRAEENLRFLAKANELLVASLDWERTLAAIAELAVPALAGYLVIDLLDDEDELHWVVAVHADPEKTELVRELRVQYPPTVSTHPIQVVLRTGRAAAAAGSPGGGRGNVARREARARDPADREHLRPRRAAHRARADARHDQPRNDRGTAALRRVGPRDGDGARAADLARARQRPALRRGAGARPRRRGARVRRRRRHPRRRGGHRPALEPDRRDQPPPARGRGRRPADRRAARRLAVAAIPDPGRLRAAGGRGFSPADAAGGSAGRGAVAVDLRRPLPGRHGVRVPRRHRRAGRGADEDGLRLDRVARAPHSARRDLRRRDDAPAPRRRGRGGAARQAARGRLERGRPARAHRERHPLGESARVGPHEHRDRAV